MSIKSAYYSPGNYMDSQEINIGVFSGMFSKNPYFCELYIPCNFTRRNKILS
jgi:hypothetical protein